jgi:hypothetical protein
MLVVVEVAVVMPLIHQVVLVVAVLVLGAVLVDYQQPKWQAQAELLILVVVVAVALTTLQLTQPNQAAALAL